MEYEHEGLSTAQARRRLEQTGKNELSHRPPPTAAGIFLSQFKDLMTVILAVATLLSAFLGQVTDAVTILAIVLLNAVMGFVQEYRTEKTMEALASLSSPVARVVRDGKLCRLSAAELVPGDLVNLTAGDRIPADGRCLRPQTVTADESLLTGESVPVVKAEGDPLSMGTCLTGGHCQMTVTATGMNTEMGHIAGMLDHEEEKRTPLQQRLDDLGKFIAVGCILVCVAVSVIGWLAGEDALTMLLTGISLSVAAIPEGLPAIVTIVLALSVGRILKKGAIIRRMHAGERANFAGVRCTSVFFLPFFPKQTGKVAPFMLSVHDVIGAALTKNPSDLHLSVGIPPVCRVNGQLEYLSQFGVNTREALEYWLGELLSADQFEELIATGDLDISLTPDDRSVRMRLNAYRQRGSYSIALRVLNQQIPSFEELGIPRKTAEAFCRLHHGLVLVTGPTGTGKTTSISSMIDWINHNRSCHVITIEDPIEYFHKHDKSMVHQRETGADTKTFRTALRAALREDPDVLFIGEMRDLESVSTALTAAETGHLVFSTLHTIGAAKTIDRIIDVFPTNQQQQVRVQLATALQGIVSQQLLLAADGESRALAAEIMIATPAIRNMIRESHVQMVDSAIATGAAMGMRTMDASLAQLVLNNRVTLEEARFYSSTPEQFDQLLRRR